MRFAKMYSQIWQSDKFSALTSVPAQLLYCYLLSCKHCNCIGIYRLPVGYVFEDMKTLDSDPYQSIEQLEADIDELVKVGLIRYDKEKSIVVINNFLKFNPVNTPAHVTSALREIKRTPKTKETRKALDFIYSTIKGKKAVSTETVKEFYAQWNNFVEEVGKRGFHLSKARETLNRNLAIKRLEKEFQGELSLIEAFDVVLRHLSQREFYLGNSERGWCVDIDWISKHGNFVKVFEMTEKKVIDLRQKMKEVRYGR